MIMFSGPHSRPDVLANTASGLEVTGAAVVMGSSDPAHLAEIKRPSISLAEWWRRSPVEVPSGDLTGPGLISFESACDGVGGALRSALEIAGSRSWHETLAADADHLAMQFATIMEASRLFVRLEAISDDACTRFHADHVRVRLLCTYLGPGTEWVASSEATAARIHRIGTGNVGLFKGLLWAPTTPILHRSPPIAGSGRERLLLTIDVAEISTYRGSC